MEKRIKVQVLEVLLDQERDLVFRPSATESPWRHVSREMGCWGPRVEEARQISRLLESSSEKRQ